MKALLILGYFLFQISHHLTAQWDDISISTNSGLNSVSFVDEMNGFVAGANEIYKTEDGGVQWERVHHASSLVSIEDIRVIDDSFVIAVGYDFENTKSVILRSTDSGTSFIAVDHVYEAFLMSVFFVDDTTGFIAGHNDFIIKTNDGGLTWVRADSPFFTNIFLQSIFFVNPSVGFVVGGTPGQSAYGRSIDGGLHWDEIEINTDSYLQSVFFIDDLRGYIVGWNGEILYSEDGGLNWVHQTSVNMNGNLEVMFTNDSTGYIAGGASDLASIQKTTNHGIIWNETAPFIEYGLTDIDFPSENVGYAVGRNGTVLKTTNGATTSIARAPTGNFIIYPNPTNNVLQVENEDFSFSVELFDAAGTKIAGAQLVSCVHSLDLSSYSPGNYYLLIRSDNYAGIHKIIKV